MSLRRSSSLALLFALLTPALAQQPLVIPREDVNAFVDGLFDIQMKRDDAAGAALLLAQHGVTLVSRGFGMADVSAAVPMTDHTPVRGGALTTAIIACAVMQQVEAGRVDLDADVTRYLDLPLEPRMDGPITLRELLTHSAGFAGSRPPAGGTGLRNFLLTSSTPRAFPAGAVHSFSGYGMALAAYIVERVTHQDFNLYAAKAIFIPLGMNHSTMQPLPEEVASKASRGYGPSTQGPLPLEATEPSMSLWTTAEDMGRFGVMLLGQGTLDGHKVLAPGSVQTILSRQAPVALGLIPEIPTMALAFHQVWFNGARFFGLSGDTAAFHSELDIDLERELVLFLAYNSSGHPGLPGEPSKLTTFARGEVIHGIFDRYQPFHPKVLNAMPDAGQQRLATGTWIPAAVVGDLPADLHLLHTMVDPATHALVGDRFISDRDTVKHWPMLLPNLWQQYPQDRILFIPGRNGVPDRLALAADPASDWVRFTAP